MSEEIEALVKQDPYGRTSYANFCDEASEPISDSNVSYINHNSD